MSVTTASIFLLLLFFEYSTHVAGDRAKFALQGQHLATVARDPSLERLVNMIGNETDVEELLELCAVETSKFLQLWMSDSVLDSCRKRLRDLMVAKRKKKISRWKFVAAGVPCGDTYVNFNMSLELCKCNRISRKAKKDCANFCQGRAGFSIVMKPGSLLCSCCKSLSPQRFMDSTGFIRQYKLMVSTGVQRSRGRIAREDTDVCHSQRLQGLDRGTVNFSDRNGQPVQVAVTKKTPPAFFACPQLCLEDAEIASNVYGDNTLLIWMYPLAKSSPVWCQDSNEDFHSLWSYMDAQNVSYDVSVCHSDTYYPLPMLKASMRPASIVMDDIATYGHTETDGHTERGVCKNLFLRGLDEASALMSPLVVELAFDAVPRDRGCDCFAGAFFTRFKSLSLTINGVSFDICSSTELNQICGSGELLRGKWSMRTNGACNQDLRAFSEVVLYLAVCIITVAVVVVAWRRFGEVTTT